MANKKPAPLIVESLHPRCPVCGEKSYSPAGIHPQCAVRQADAERLRLPLPRRVKTIARPVRHVLPWQKVCPKCDVLQHLRKKICECGHAFSFHPHESTNTGKHA